MYVKFQNISYQYLKLNTHQSKSKKIDKHYDQSFDNINIKSFLVII